MFFSIRAVIVPVGSPVDNRLEGPGSVSALVVSIDPVVAALLPLLRRFRHRRWSRSIRLTLRRCVSSSARRSRSGSFNRFMRGGSNRRRRRRLCGGGSGKMLKCRNDLGPLSSQIRESSSSHRAFLESKLPHRRSDRISPESSFHRHQVGGL